MSTSPEQRKANRRLGLILASVAIAFMVGFMVKMTWLGH
ncbi:cytochrome oxidase small assembly protein [Pelomonas sp. APW6]|uniref:Cytochrome oxidase small assembly protein n=1 Tax=Roseateles subflavus TaxID=3053353 RepID=A0ABT7LMA2_9BURK|nr:cytochrome oxidase small assembly protein [Pelomonas sp. APW6]MDL5032820.1 cytochrome oxidase small assembly protein [Pelomonas sp. APW6]